jgi:hypothetical protein
MPNGSPPICPHANLRRVPNAWHFAFMDSPGMSDPQPGRRHRREPAGVRSRCVPEAARRRITAFFDKALL